MGIDLIEDNLPKVPTQTTFLPPPSNPSAILPKARPNPNQNSPKCSKVEIFPRNCGVYVLNLSHEDRRQYRFVLRRWVADLRLRYEQQSNRADRHAYKHIRQLTRRGHATKIRPSNATGLSRSAPHRVQTNQTY